MTSKSQEVKKRDVTFNRIEYYIKEIDLIDRTPRSVKLINQTQPFEKVVIQTQIALKPESIVFAGCYNEDWEITLN